MTEKDIRPIPNYILKEIHKRDMKIYPWQENIVRFYAYLTVWKKELIKVTVAVSTIKGKQWACKQVAVHGIHSPKCYVRDMEYNYLGHGFNTGQTAETRIKNSNGSVIHNVTYPPIFNTPSRLRRRGV